MSMITSEMIDAACEAEEMFGVDYLELISRPGQCPLCSGAGYVLGFMGQLTWLRCRQCGIEFSRETEPEPNFPARYTF